MIRIATDSYETSIGFLIARANVTEISYGQSGKYFCKAESDGLMDEMSIDITVQCRKYKSYNNMFTLVEKKWPTYKVCTLPFYDHAQKYFWRHDM